MNRIRRMSKTEREELENYAFYFALVVVIGFSIILFAKIYNREKGKDYSVNAQVFFVSDKSVFFEDENGNVWEYENGASHYFYNTNKEYKVVLNNRNTEKIEDDKIVEIIEK